ncbi:MAG TPA: SIS domain-containing protein, partial [Candidatus Baltobacteraceae bacterium]|nr:SIS domain-containing protein [Candidatus Baltobacteraceae bacterium]
MRRPDDPLPGAPDPWAGSTMPPVRSGPPFVMTEMIEAEPAFAERLLRRLLLEGSPASGLARAIRSTVEAGRPVLVVGCGTSEHGAMAAAAILADAVGSAPSAGRIVARQALETALAPQDAGLLLGISHEGGTWATNEALAAARGAGIPTALITVSDRSPGAALADIVVTTDEADQSWCHTVGYLSPILAAAAVGALARGAPLDTAAIRALLADGVARAAAAGSMAAGLVDVEQLLVIASGSDRPAARELALKVEEASYLPTVARDLETILHGHLPATGRTTGLVLLMTDRARRDDRARRARGVLEAAGLLGLRAGAILADGVADAWPDELTPVGRLRVPEAPALSAPAAALIGSTTPLQLLAERLARAR